MVLVIYNPACGDSNAKALFTDRVLPLLKEKSITISQVVETEKEGHAGDVALEYFNRTDGAVDIILGSGDGTIHEVISAISLSPHSAELKARKVTLVVVPCGTANALYSSLYPRGSGEDDASYLLKGIHAFFGKSKPNPLSLAITSILSPAITRKPVFNAVSAVVTSTSLHASILNDSEALRAEIPGIERFKVAAQKNITRWYKTFVKVLPYQSSGRVEVYDPNSKSFVPHPDSDYEHPVVELDGPFAYFLSTVNVDRLEPEFRISPLNTSLPGKGAHMDLVIIRPLRDQTLDSDSPENKLKFAEKAGAVLGAAYRNGEHVELRYDGAGAVGIQAQGETVVEYFRCGGWEWEPDGEDEAAHLVCNDGRIHAIPKGGKTVCHAATAEDEAGFVVYL